MIREGQPSRWRLLATPMTWSRVESIHPVLTSQSMRIPLHQRQPSGFSHPPLVFQDVGRSKAYGPALADPMVGQFTTGYESIDCVDADLQTLSGIPNGQRLIGLRHASLVGVRLHRVSQSQRGGGRGIVDLIEVFAVECPGRGVLIVTCSFLYSLI